MKSPRVEFGLKGSESVAAQKTLSYLKALPNKAVESCYVHANKWAPRENQLAVNPLYISAKIDDIFLPLVKEYMEKNGLTNLELHVKTVPPSYISNWRINSCLPGLLSLSKGANSTVSYRTKFPSINFVTPLFHALTGNIKRSPELPTKPLFELMILINQLYGLTYLESEPMVLQLASIALDKPARELLALSTEALRNELADLPRLRNIFFVEEFKFFKFTRPGKTTGLGGKLQMEDVVEHLRDFMIAFKQGSDNVDPEMKKRFEGVQGLFKGTNINRGCLVLQIRSYTKLLLEDGKTVPDELRGVHYQVVKLQKFEHFANDSRECQLHLVGPTTYSKIVPHTLHTIGDLESFAKTLIEAGKFSYGESQDLIHRVEIFRLRVDKSKEEDCKLKRMAAGLVYRSWCKIEGDDEAGYSYGETYTSYEAVEHIRFALGIKDGAKWRQQMLARYQSKLTAKRGEQGAPNAKSGKRGGNNISLTVPPFVRDALTMPNCNNPVLVSSSHLTSL